MYIDAETINSLAKLLGSVTIIAGAILGVYKFIERDRRQSKILRDVQEENTLLCYGLSACLDGLMQLGANHKVTDAHERLDKHLNKKAHDQAGS